jgi:ABC-type branched-subunit amino acid transport system ATPase component
MAMGDNPNVAFHIVRGITRQEFDTGIAILLVKQNARKALSICDKA